MRLIFVAAMAIIVLAAAISIGGTVQPLKMPQLLATTTLTLAVAIQRINGIQRWLSSPKNRRKENVSLMAQQALFDVCRGLPLSQEVFYVSVHVWEVPLWYRRLFPYKLRTSLKNIARRDGFNGLRKWTLRPSLNRVAAVGLQKAVPSGVQFKKGVGLVGVCIATNDHTEVITLNIANKVYQDALNSPTEDEWRRLPPEITRNLSLADAKRLAKTHGQVIGKVIQNMESGEAIGCATISCRLTSPQTIKLTNANRTAQRALADLALSLSGVLA